MKLCSVSPTIVTEFLQRSVGKWHSQRRYYTLNSTNDPVLEADSQLEVFFLEGDRPELLELAKKHGLTQPIPFSCGAKIVWESTYTNVQRKPLQGETLFGIQDNKMYRDRGFSTPRPIVATFAIPSPEVLHLATAYDGAAFEEEIKFIGQGHRTRQTIISKAGQEVMVGQYLETRVL
ncbi:phycobiliprotein lyase [[Limnothrix rosea] IAM M-220]|uniref:phycobiliprotein lyase n=1 Tax=[Limnothrix rosea] IAM M-220 TaxID=454133 RepID=UPI00095EF661|nr:phycobiliprotein lyase [[Limnothrix rosea] IAM M-220]OKH17010.1 phycobiliprotein lyase [[Limnothrix rosea] IAM M-220]